MSRPRRASTIASMAGRLSCWRKVSRVWRLTRLRATAVAMFFLAITKPSRAQPSVLNFARINRCWCESLKVASSKTCWKSWLLRRRDDLGKEAVVTPVTRAEREFPQAAIKAERRLSAETLAAFGATTCQNLATTFGSHTGTKAVSAFALKDTGLKGSLHLATANLVCVNMVRELNPSCSKPERPKNQSGRNVT